MFNSIYEDFCKVNEVLSVYDWGEKSPKKLMGAVVANLFKHHIEKVIKDKCLDDVVKVSANNCYIGGSSSEYDLLLVKADAEPVYGLIYKAEDVVAVIECKGGGLYNLEEDVTNIANAVNNAAVLNPNVKFGYMTMWENVPVNELNSKGFATVNHWEATKELFEDKLADCVDYIIYAVTLKKGKELTTGSDKEFEEFVCGLVENFIKE